ncbi:hypothetical protein SNE40_007503 [Patella caerulea]|uniref:Uncharacterized protein n=1 Tax=Patella caerulea TaxID=87958 RepID=A0AAN8JZY8_PATCE
MDEHVLKQYLIILISINLIKETIAWHDVQRKDGSCCFVDLFCFGACFKRSGRSDHGIQYISQINNVIVNQNLPSNKDFVSKIRRGFNQSRHSRLNTEHAAVDAVDRIHLLSVKPTTSKILKTIENHLKDRMRILGRNTLEKPRKLKLSSNYEGRWRSNVHI